MTRDTTLYEYQDYRLYLRDKLQRLSLRGAQSKLAEAIRCQPTYVTLVLQEKSHLSQEQAMLASEFLGHSDLETEYFLTLLQWDRAGSDKLKSFYLGKLKELKSQSGKIGRRIKPQRTLSAEHQALYYSSWAFAAIHMAVTISELQDRHQIAKQLNLPVKNVTRVLDGLLEMRLISNDGGRLKPAEKEIWIGGESFNKIQHHTNWRNRAIASLDSESENELHYSAVVTLSQSDLPRVREVLLNAIKQNVEIIKSSKSEDELFCFTLDLFDLRS